MIFYTNRFVPAHAAACARGPFIFIRHEYKEDKGLLAHELVHVWQWIRTLGLHSFLYLLIPEYRLASEVDAYKKQAKYYQDDRLPRFAKFIAERYGLNISEANALNLLRE